MPTIDVHLNLNQDRFPSAAGHRQKPINVTVATWHAAFPGGSSVNATSDFTNPDPSEADRIPELALAASGTPGTYTITGTYGDRNGTPKDQTDQITTVANATVKGSKPFDTITSIVGPAPGQTLTLNKGDAYFDPPMRALWTGTVSGDAVVQLLGEDAVQAVVGLPASIDWPRRVKRYGTASTLTAPWAVW